MRHRLAIGFLRRTAEQMALSAHLINLLSVQERQELEPVGSAVSQPANGGKSFAEALEESMSEPTERRETVALAQLVAAQGDVETALPESVGRQPMMQPGQAISAGRLVEKFITEHDLAIAAQRTPDSRYRTQPSDDTSGEAGVRANLRPIE